MIELSYANVAGIVVVSALLGGTFAQLGPWFLGWTDERRDRKIRVVTAGTIVSRARGGQVQPARLGDDVLGILFDETPSHPPKLLGMPAADQARYFEELRPRLRGWGTASTEIPPTPRIGDDR